MGEFSLAAICWSRFTHESERSRSSEGEAAVEDAEEDVNRTAEFENSDRWQKSADLMANEALWEAIFIYNIRSPLQPQPQISPNSEFWSDNFLFWFRWTAEVEVDITRFSVEEFDMIIYQICTLIELFGWLKFIKS